MRFTTRNLLETMASNDVENVNVKHVSVRVLVRSEHDRAVIQQAVGVVLDPWSGSRPVPFHLDMSDLSTFDAFLKVVKELGLTFRMTCVYENSGPDMSDIGQVTPAVLWTIAETMPDPPQGGLVMEIEHRQAAVSEEDVIMVMFDKPSQGSRNFRAVVEDLLGDRFFIQDLVRLPRSVGKTTAEYQGMELCGFSISCNPGKPDKPVKLHALHAPLPVETAFANLKTSQHDRAFPNQKWYRRFDSKRRKNR